MPNDTEGTSMGAKTEALASAGGRSVAALRRQVDASVLRPSSGRSSTRRCRSWSLEARW
jgi:hypothetical protein